MIGMNKKRLGIFIILLILVTSFGLSYAYWQFGVIQKELNVAGTKCFSLTYKDNTEAIMIDNMVPTKDEEGLKEKGYSFTIKNTCNTIATYDVNLEDILASSNVKHFPNQYIKISLNDSTPKVLNTYEEVETTITNATNSFKLTSGSLKPDEEATYELKLWMDIETPAVDDVMSATFESKITVNTSYIEEENLANDITIIATSQNKDYSKEKEIFTIDITSTNKNIIEYSFNKQNWTSVTPTKNLSLKQEYTKEGSYFIYVKDEVGNVKEYTINTDKLDQVAPKRIIEGTNNHETYLLKITMNDEKSGMDSYQITESKETPSEWLSYTGVIEKEISNNGIYYIWSKDKSGNMSYEAYSINKIDKEAPTITLTNNLTDWGKRDIIHIRLTDELIGLSGYQVTTIEKEPESFITIENTLETTIDYEVEENNTYYVYAKDAYNHVSHKKIVIDKIDGIVPIINTITNSSNGKWTNKNVTITIDAIDNETSIAKYQTKSSKTNNVWTDLTGNTDTFTAEINETVYYRVIDVAGNISKESTTVVKIDKSAPSKPNITNSKENIWTGSDLPVTLTSADSASGIDHYEWYENGAWTTRTLTTTGNTGSITYTATRNETIRFRAVDKVGNVSEESTTIVKIDKDKPTITSVVNSSNGNWTNQSIDITINAADNSSGISKYQVKYSGNNNTWTDLKSNTDNWSAECNETVYYRVVDNAGNISEESTTVIKIDKDKPTITSVVNSSNGNWTNQSIDITINAADNSSGISKYQVKYSGNNNTWTDLKSNTDNWSAERNETVYYRVVDNAGNVSEEKNTNIKIDKTSPAQSLSIASSTSGSNGWYKALSIKASVSDSQSGISSAKYCATTSSNCTPSTNASLSNNTFTVALATNSSAQKVCVNTTDKVGNVSNTDCTGTYKVDTTNPTAKISTSVSGSSITINASGSSDSGSGIATYYYSKDGGSSFVTSSSSSYTFTGLSNGTYTLVVKVLDKSGRMSNTVSTSNKIAISQKILGGTINSGWTLSGFEWEYYDSYWQLYGGAKTTTLSAISDSTYNLSSYNTISVSIWMYWDYNNSTTTTYYVYVCSTKTNCTNVSSSSYDYASGHYQSKNISANISGYNGNYYIKVSVSKTRSNQGNVGTIILNP